LVWHEPELTEKAFEMPVGCGGRRLWAQMFHPRYTTEWSVLQYMTEPAFMVTPAGVLLPE